MATTVPVDSDGTSLNMVADGAANGAIVGVTAFATGSGAVAYTLTDTAGGRFQIDAVTGLITVANAGLLDAADASYTVEVEADDGDTTEVQTFTIRVVDAASLIEQTGDAALALNPAGDAYRIMEETGLDIALTRNSNPFGPSTVPQWQAIAVEKDGAGGYDVLWQRTNGDLAHWKVDSAGAYVSDTYYPVGSQTEAILEDLELTFAMELEGDAEIGPNTTLERNGNVELRLNPVTDTYIIGDDSTEFDVSRNNAAYGPSTVPQWQAIQVEDIMAGGYKVLWERNNGDYAVWTLDSAGEYVSDIYHPIGRQTYQLVRDLESAFETDLDGNGRIGHEATLDSHGQVDLLLNAAGDEYHILDGSVDLVVSRGGNPFGPDTVPQWQATQVERNGGGNGYYVLWERTIGDYAIWSVDDSGAWTTDTYLPVGSLTRESLTELELRYGLELTGNTRIGPPLERVDRRGDVDLVLDFDGYHIVDGATDVVLTRGGKAMSDDTVPQWRAIHAEEDGSGGYNVLWERTNGDYAVWNVNAAGQYVSDMYYPIGSHTTALIETIETEFEADLNGDGFIRGNLDTIMLAGAVSGDHSGWSVSSAGDVDGDGLADIIIGAYNSFHDGPAGVGLSYVVLGSALAGFGSGEIDLDELTPAQSILIKGIDAGDNSGYSVSSAGDVDGDGLDDVVIGAPFGDAGAFSSGESYVIFGAALSAAAAGGGEIDPAAMTAAEGIVFKGIDVNELSGSSVASAGDVDGDGTDDVIIGVPQGLGNTEASGKSYVIFGTAIDAAAAGFGEVDLATLAASDGILIKGIDEADQSGFSVSSAGDVDGDGKDDIVIGAYLASPDGISGAGESYVVFGSALSAAAPAGEIDLGSLAASDGVLIKGANANDGSAYAVSSAGDVDGDGKDDIVIGVRHGESGSAAGHLIFGTTLVAASTGTGEVNLGALSAAEGLLIKRAGAGDLAGSSVSSAGDVDRDGKADIIIGVENSGTYPGGASYLLFGASLSAAAAGSGEIDLAELTSTDGVVLTGVDAADLSGHSVSGAGDIDGDGHGDILIGAPDAAPDGIGDAGETYVISGATLTAEKFADGLITLGDIPEHPSVLIKGVNARDETGATLADAGDIDGDGLGDVLIGSYRSLTSRPTWGESYLIFGATLKAAAADGVVDLDTLSSTEGIILAGNSTNARSGYSVSRAGDVNADGLEDIIVGVYEADPDGRNEAGETYVVMGSALQSAAAGSGEIDMGELVAAEGIVIKGEDDGHRSGWSVSAAGDVDGDGRDDILVGAPHGEAGGSRQGQTYVVLGRAIEAAAAGSGEIGLSALTSDGVMLKSIDPLTALMGWSVSGLGDIDGDGLADVVVGGSIDGNIHLVAGSTIRDTAAGNGEVELGASATDFGVLIEVANTLGRGGLEVDSAGDVDGDGLPDLVVGIWGAGATGESYVVFGSALRELMAISGEIQIEAMPFGAGVAIMGIKTGNDAGWSISGAGDVDADGLDDIIIGAPGAAPHGATAAGKTYVILGSTLSAAGADTGEIDLASLAPAQGIIIEGVDSIDYSGYAVSSAGDVDGDGRDDILIGAPNADPDGANNAGEVYLITGQQLVDETLDDGVIDLSDFWVA